MPPARPTRPPWRDERKALEERLSIRPWWLDYTAGFFPVITLVFLLRSFLYEPFRIPSGSMIPTLQIGDLILVNKFEYGIRLPVVNRTMLEIGRPQARRRDRLSLSARPEPGLHQARGGPARATGSNTAITACA